MILPSPNAPLGSVSHLDTYAPSDFPHGSAVLCRNTAPLIALAFDFIQRNRGVRVLGRDIGVGLASAVKRLKADDITTLRERLASDLLRELAATASEAKRDAINDRYRTLNLLTRHATTVPQLLSNIETMFGDENPELLTLSTIHKAKGLEWSTVFLLDFHSLLPSRWATQPWQLQQEKNLQYVAVTRAKLDLRFIESDCWT